MNSTTNKNTILHRSSRKINRPALSVPVGRADFEISVAAHACNPLSLSSSLPLRSFLIPQNSTEQRRAGSVLISSAGPLTVSSACKTKKTHQYRSLYRSHISEYWAAGESGNYIGYTDYRHQLCFGNSDSGLFHCCTTFLSELNSFCTCQVTILRQLSDAQA